MATPSTARTGVFVCCGGVENNLGHVSSPACCLNLPSCPQPLPFSDFIQTPYFLPLHTIHLDLFWTIGPHPCVFTCVTSSNRWCQSSFCVQDVFPVGCPGIAVALLCGYCFFRGKHCNRGEVQEEQSLPLWFHCRISPLSSAQFINIQKSIHWAKFEKKFVIDWLHTCWFSDCCLEDNLVPSSV